MADRRSLVEGIKPRTREEERREREFVFGERAEPKMPLSSAVMPRRNEVAKAPITTRIRADYATAIKRASLERQLSGVKPNTMQEILEEALEPWLVKEGYL